MNTPTSDELRSQHERLQSSLATRQSVLHFAHAGVSFLVSLILAGAAAKLFWDSAKVPYLGFATVGLVLGLVSYSAVHYRKGRRELSGELKRYGDLLELRRQLQLDNPAKLLPQ